MKRTIGILAHVDAGKTTLSEDILLKTGVLRAAGRVDRADTFLDTDSQERRRGITIFSGQARFSLGGGEWILLDTPGHTDFAAEMERALGMLDAAVVVVSVPEGIQAHTEVILRLLEKRQIPTFFFLNKMDMPGADAQPVLERLSAKTGAAVVDLTEGLGAPSAAEALAESDEMLLELYLSGDAGSEAWNEQLRDAVRARRLMPAVRGAALRGEGTEALLALLPALVSAPYPADAPFSARVYQVRHDAKGERLLFLKLLAGRLAVKDTLAGEKTDAIRLYQGERYTAVAAAEAGEICAVTGIHGLKAGDTVGSDTVEQAPQLQPVMTSRVTWEDVPDGEVLAAFRTLEDEDPLLKVEWDANLHQLVCAVMGKVQLEVLEETVRTRFGLDITFGPCRVAYRETLARPVIGMAHYEPLRHYAETHLLLEPGPRGSGITFESACPVEVLTPNFQNLIRTHVFEKVHKGVLTGAPLTDIHITLLAGRMHLKHTEGGDFRQTVYRAIRMGMLLGESVLLEPMYDFTVAAPAEYLGRVMADITQRAGTFEAPEQRDDEIFVKGRGPAACFAEYAVELPASTRGRGRFTPVFGGYEPCHDAERVIAEAGYNYRAEWEDSPDSMFCSHGAGFLVPAEEVPRYAHISREVYEDILRKKELNL